MHTVRHNGLLCRAGTRAWRVGAKSDLAKARLAVVVSKKVAKQAVKRNRIRRVLKEAARKEFKTAEQARDLVLIVLPGFEASTLKEAQQKLRPLLRKALVIP